MQLRFAHKLLNYEAATSHFAYIGTTGSGKTVQIRLLMQSVVNIATTKKVPTRMLVYDSKRDMLPVLYGMFERLERKDAKEKITLINPFDQRGARWDMAKDITEPAHAQELASILIPDEPNTKEPFFPNAARLIVENVLLSFITKSSKDWTFRDVCLAVETKKSIVSVLSRSGRTSWVIDALFGEEKTTANIIASIATAMRPYRIVAALWDKAKDSISLREWIQSEEKILVLGNSPTNRTAIDAINQVLFKRLSQIILEEQEEIDFENDHRRVWVFIDEFVRAGRLNGAVELATEGRSKGVSFVIGFQDINGLRAVYGREVAEEIVGQCANVALLRMQSPDTAEWASKFIGEKRRIETDPGLTIIPGGGTQVSSSDRTMDRPDYLPSFFREIPPVSKGTRQGVYGLCYSPFPPLACVAPFHNDFEWLFEKGNLWPKSKAVKGFERCANAEDQYLAEWSEEKRGDFTRLGLTPEQQAKGGDSQLPTGGGQQGAFTQLKDKVERPISNESVLSNPKSRERLLKSGIKVVE